MKSTDAGGRPGRDFGPERAQESSGRTNIFEAAAAHIAALQKVGKRVVIACWSEGSADRMGGVLADHGAAAIKRIGNFREAKAMHASAIGLAVLGLEHGFEGPDFALITEQDVIGDRMVRARGRVRRSQNFLAEASSLAAGDLVTHIEHGVGRYLGLKTLDVAGAPHDCLELQYDGGKLFLPVENIELLTRYGSEDAGVQLDKLGGVGWQNRKARMKARVREMAAELIRIAASRAMKQMDPVETPAGLYDEFCARFPYAETEDQERAIAEVIEDLGKGQADGSSRLRRCRLRQDGSGASRGLRHGDVGQPGGRRRADDAPRAPALPDVLRALQRPARPDRAIVALHAAKGREGGQGKARRAETWTSSSGRMRCLPKASPSAISAS